MNGPLGGNRRVRIFLGWPWYSGPADETYTSYFEFIHYLGRLQERSLWLNKYGDEAAVELDCPLDPDGLEGDAELLASDGIFDFGCVNIGGSSLVGKSREVLVDAALRWDADYLFTWDDDMVFPWETLLRLLRHQKPVVNALGFASKEPHFPCLWRLSEQFTNPDEPQVISDVVYDPPMDKLITDEDVGGPIAFGAGITLYNMSIFKKMPKPWFFSTGTGEDWFFCLRCHQHGIRRYVDTGVKVRHLMKKPQWVDTDFYSKFVEENTGMFDELKAKQDAERVRWSKAIGLEDSDG